MRSGSAVAAWVPRIAAWAVPLCIYVVSARRDVWFWDTGEMDTVPWILGIAHPTAFPAFVLLGYVFSHVFAIGSVAFRMSIMSACAMAATAYFVARTVEDDGGNAWVGAAAAWLFAFGAIVWTRGTRAEVHALAACAFAATIFFTLRWYRGGTQAALYAAAIAWGIGLAVHPVLLLAVPAIAFAVVVRRGPFPVAGVARAALLGVCSAAVWYLYLPLRSATVSAPGLAAERALGLPHGAPFWDYDHPAALHGFVALAGGGDFNIGSVLASIAAGNPHGAGFPLYASELLAELTPFGAAAALFGIAVAWKRDRARAAALVLFALPCVIFGASFPAESDPRRYFIESYFVAAVFAGGAFSCVARSVPRVRILAASACAALALLLVVQNRWIFAQAGDERARAVIAAVQRQTPDDAILVASWLDAPPLAYAAYVEHSLGSRSIAVAWVGDLGPYLPRWPRTRPAFVIGPSNAGGLAGYGLVEVAPHSPVFALVP